MNRPMVASILALAFCACEQNSVESNPPAKEIAGNDRFVSMDVETRPKKQTSGATAESTLIEPSRDVVPRELPTVTSEESEVRLGSIGLGIHGAGLGGGGLDAKGAGGIMMGEIGHVGRGAGAADGLGLNEQQGDAHAIQGGGEGLGRVGGLGKVGTGGGRGIGGKFGGHGSGNARISVGRVTVGGYGRGLNPSRPADSELASGAESYQNHGTNAFTNPASDRFSTFAIDVDTGSYTIARRKLNEGGLPPASAVRVEEFLNYFTYNYPAPASTPFAVALEAAPSPFSAKPNMYVMRVGVQAKKVTEAARKPIHLTFLVDVSGSMNTRDKLPLAQRSIAYLVDNLREQDTVAIATYAGRVSQVLRPTHASDREKILQAIEGLRAGGSTGMSDGLEAAYQLASETLDDNDISRVIVLSDGDANVGATSHDEILKRITSYVSKGVTLSTIGFGMGNYKDTMMEQLADKGNGNYYYIDDFKEAQRIFGDQLDGTLQVVAKDVKIQVEFDPAEVVAYRLIGYENRDIADKDFRNDKVDAGEIGAGHSVTALYEVELRTAEPNEFATVRIRHKLPKADTATEANFPIRVASFRDTVGAATGDFQFAVAVAGFAEILRQSTYSKDLSYDLILEVAQPHVGNDARRKEFVKLVNKAKGFDLKSKIN